MERKIRFAIFGCGGIAHTHIMALRAIDAAEVVGVADIRPDAALAFAERYSIKKVFKDYDEILNSTEVDAICICTPSGTHSSLGVLALEKNKNVILEKPMSITVAECDAIIEARKKSLGRVLVISQLRAHPDVRRAKKIIDSGALGKITICDVNMKYYRSPDYYRGSWRGTKAMDGGGALMNQGIHGVDLILHLCGDVKNVRSIKRTLVHDIEVEDTAIALLEFENGAVGMIEATTGAYPGFNRRFEISGSDGSIIINEGAIERLVIRGEGIDEYNSISTSEKASNPLVSDASDHRNQIAEFVEVLLGNDTIKWCDEHEGKRAVELIERIYNQSI